ncbi:LlaJI family restriction endonuclease [Sedimentimonas flavescens]|uniref:LlaJI family restriction endonuclease n=1 Tax=Sedimentimonas flavescens TaxID=2851012 RepID=A0ABT3A464_9RHOB|nr:LlaJI family restriction endonuclease [Sedimentimonas flavescens]MCV2880365.1 LlaJI family restriction endonuclease [Sedimentimonas flavescens]
MKTKPEVKFRVFEDRTAVNDLGSTAGSLLAILKAWDIGKIEDKETVHFCGLIGHPDLGTTAFIPRQSSTGNAEVDKEIAAYTMRALSRFGAEVSQREFESDGEAGNPNLLSVVKKLAEDFRQFGIFSERERIRTRNSGKIDWGRTLSRVVATPGSGGRPVFLDLRTSRSRSETNANLSQIQAAVMREILAMHGWWLSVGRGRDVELRSVPLPPSRRAKWEGQLSRILPTLYSARSLFLAEHLKYYLSHTRASSSGTFVFGLTDFHSVWEAMLRETLKRPPEDTGRNWTRELPKPTYNLANGSRPEARQQGMIPDIILEGRDHYTIIDAKYYAATSSATAPGWPDIAKQQFYELGMRSVVGTTPEIESIFVFPGRNSEGPLHSVAMRDSSGRKVASFPEIRCAYADVATVLIAYIKRTSDLAIGSPLSASDLDSDSDSDSDDAERPARL